MTNQEIIDAITALTAVVKVNAGFFGSEETADQANAKIQALMKLLPASPVEAITR